MIHPKIQQLAKAKAAVARLELSITKELASLHEEYGFESVDTLIVALESAVPGGKRRPRKSASAIIRKRAKITDAIRGRVGKLVKAGKTGAQIAKALRISLPSVQNVKKALGLVKASKRRVAKAKVRPTSVKAPLRRKVRTRQMAGEMAFTSKPKPSKPVAEATTSS